MSGRSNELRISVSGPDFITGESFDPERDVPFLELCVWNDYGRSWHYSRYDADTKEAVFERGDAEVLQSDSVWDGAR